MPINTGEVLGLVSQLCEEEKLQVAIKESVKGGLIAGATTMVGGLLGGPVGLAIGGTVGGCTAAYLSQGKFRSVATIIRNDLTQQQRNRLAGSVMRIFEDLHPSDLLALTAFMLQPSIKQKVLQEVFNFFKSQLNMPIIC